MYTNEVNTSIYTFAQFINIYEAKFSQINANIEDPEGGDQAGTGT